MTASLFSLNPEPTPGIGPGLTKAEAAPCRPNRSTRADLLRTPTVGAAARIVPHPEAATLRETPFPKKPEFQGLRHITRFLPVYPVEELEVDHIDLTELPEPRP